MAKGEVKEETTGSKTIEVSYKESGEDDPYADLNEDDKK